jgi:hypothetical protein
MKRAKYIFPGFVPLLFALIMVSCNLDDFNLNKLTNKEDIVPEIFAPLAYGTFKVKDFVTTGSILDNSFIPAGGLPLNPKLISKMGTTFRSSAIDTVFLVTHLTNNTLINIEYSLTFVSNTGVPLGKVFSSQKIPPGAVDEETKFPLDPTDQDNLQSATDIKLSFTISSPDVANLVQYKSVKDTPFTFKISFYAPVHLRKL